MGFLEREPCLKRTLSNGFWSLINLDLVPYVVGCLSLHSEDRHTIHTVSYLGMTLLQTSGPVIRNPTPHSFLVWIIKFPWPHWSFHNLFPCLNDPIPSPFCPPVEGGKGGGTWNELFQKPLPPFPLWFLFLCLPFPPPSTLPTSSIQSNLPRGRGGGKIWNKKMCCGNQVRHVCFWI